MPSSALLLFGAIATMLYITSIIHVTLTTVTAGATPLQAFLMVNTYGVLNMLSASAFVIRFFFDYLQNSLCIPHAVPWLLVASYLSPRVWDALGTMIAVPFQVVARVFLNLYDYRKESEEKIAALQKRVTDISAGIGLPETLITIENHSVEIEKASRESKHWESKVRNLQAANDALEVKAEYAQNEPEQFHQTSGAIQRYRLEEAHKTEVRRLHAEIDDQAKEIQQLEANVDLWRTQYQQHDCTLSSEGGQKFQDEIDILNDDVERLITDKSSVAQENGDLKTTIHKLQPQVLRLNNMTEVIHQMAENNDMHVRFAVTFFVSSLLHHGADLADLGIDPSLFETYANWATMLIAGENPPVVPVSGFRLQGSVFPLSGSFVSGGTVFGASTRLLDQAFASAQASDMQSQTQVLALTQLPPTPPQTPPQEKVLLAPESAGTTGGGRNFGSFAELIAANKAEAALQNTSNEVDVPRIVEHPPTSTLPGSFGNSVALVTTSNTDSNSTPVLDASTGAGTADEEAINPDDFFSLGGEKSTTWQPKSKSTATFGSSLNTTRAPATGPSLQPSTNTLGSLSNAPASSAPLQSNETSPFGALAGSIDQRNSSIAAPAVNTDAPFGGDYINTSPPRNGTVDTGAPFGASKYTNAAALNSFGDSQGSTQPFGSSFTSASPFVGFQSNNGFAGTGQNENAALQAKLMRNASPFGSLASNNGPAGMSGGSGAQNDPAPFGSSQNRASAFTTSGGFGGQYNSMPISGMMNSPSNSAPHGAYSGTTSGFGSSMNDTSGFGGPASSTAFGTPSSLGQPSNLGQTSSGGFGQSQTSTFGQPSNIGQSNFSNPSGFGVSNSSGFGHSNNTSAFGTVSTWRSSDNAGVPRNTSNSFTMIREPPSATGVGDDDDTDDRELQLSGARSKKNPWR